MPLRHNMLYLCCFRDGNVMGSDIYLVNNKKLITRNLLKMEPPTKDKLRNWHETIITSSTDKYKTSFSFSSIFSKGLALFVFLHRGLISSQLPLLSGKHPHAGTMKPVAPPAGNYSLTNMYPGWQDGQLQVLTQDWLRFDCFGTLTLS